MKQNREIFRFIIFERTSLSDLIVEFVATTIFKIIYYATIIRLRKKHFLSTTHKLALKFQIKSVVEEVCTKKHGTIFIQLQTKLLSVFFCWYFLWLGMTFEWNQTSCHFVDDWHLWQAEKNVTSVWVNHANNTTTDGQNKRSFGFSKKNLQK